MIEWFKQKTLKIDGYDSPHTGNDSFSVNGQLPTEDVGILKLTLEND